ncbi:GINS complex subunit [Steccherinum ochraceum]|uniref:DNA replication complex GINS protein SLD5 n=1 Tax=Steccherinum ochraceum TaxID=92696 RepID=A0A4R0RNW9_9APHY|nr:GINS complex subunit [Steccherinum ochraceum]
MAPRVVKLLCLFLVASCTFWSALAAPRRTGERESRLGDQLSAASSVSLVERHPDPFFLWDWVTSGLDSAGKIPEVADHLVAEAMKTYSEASDQITRFLSTLKATVAVVAGFIQALETAGSLDSFDGDMGKLLQEIFLPPDQAPGHEERKVAVHATLKRVEDGIVALCVGYGMDEGEVRPISSGISAHLEMLVVIIGDVGEQYSEVVEMLLCIVSRMLPQAWLLQLLIGLIHTPKSQLGVSVRSSGIATIATLMQCPPVTKGPKFKLRVERALTRLSSSFLYDPSLSTDLNAIFLREPQDFDSRHQPVCVLAHLPLMDDDFQWYEPDAQPAANAAPPPRADLPIRDDFEPAREFAPPAEETSFQQLIRHWMNERHAPDLLPAREMLLGRLLDHIRKQTDDVQLLRADPSSSEDEHFRIMLVQTEVERVKFVIRSYIRTRLHKVEKYARHIVSTPELHQKLSKGELDHARRYAKTVEDHFSNSVLRSLPPEQQSLDDNMAFMPPMIPAPDKTHAVFAYARQSCPPVHLPDGSTMELTKGQIVLTPYHVVEHLLIREDVELV